MSSLADIVLVESVGLLRVFFFFSRADIFVFLLSTRAGGLGINLTAADTVSNSRFIYFTYTYVFICSLLSTFGFYSFRLSGGS